ncbi:MAG: hypothetical protein IJ083_08415 [Clostridia bacterium]|nr:hypothetical protein [Clostridia bacterium]
MDLGQESREYVQAALEELVIGASSMPLWEVFEVTPGDYASVPVSRLTDVGTAAGIRNLSLERCLRMSVSDLLKKKGMGRAAIRRLLNSLYDFFYDSDESAQDVPYKAVTPLIEVSDCIEKGDWNTVRDQLKKRTDGDEQKTLMELSRILEAAVSVDLETLLRLIDGSDGSNAIDVTRQLILDKQEEGYAEDIWKAFVEDAEYLIGRLPEDRKALKLQSFWKVVGKKNLAPKLEAFLKSRDPDFQSLIKCLPVMQTWRPRDLFVFLMLLAWANFHLDADVREIIRVSFRREEYRYVVKERMKGKTLEAIGQVVESTREWVRQLEKRAVDFAVEKAKEMRTFHKLLCLNEGNNLMAGDLIRRSLGTDGDLVTFMFSDAKDTPKLPYQYEEGSDLFVFFRPHYSKAEMEQFISSLPNTIPASDIPQLLAKAEAAHLPLDVTEYRIRHEFNSMGDSSWFQRGRMNLAEKCAKVLEFYYPGGIHATDSRELVGFRKHLKELFGDTKISETDHALCAVITRVGMLRDRGTYAPYRENILPKELVEEIRDYIRQGDSGVYMANTLFEIFRDKLAPYGVDNRFYMQGVLKPQLEGEFETNRDYFFRDSQSNQLHAQIRAYVKDKGGFVKKTELNQAFPAVPQMVMSMALQSTEIISSFGDYIHVDNLHLTKKDILAFKKAIVELLQDGNVHKSTEVLQQMKTNYPEILEKVQAHNQFGLFSTIQSLLTDDVVTLRPNMALTGTPGATRLLTQKDKMLHSRKEREPRTIVREVTTYQDILQAIRATKNKGMNIQDIYDRYHITKQRLDAIVAENNMMTIGERLIDVDTLKGVEEDFPEITKLMKDLFDDYTVVRSKSLVAILGTWEPMTHFLKTNSFKGEEACLDVAKYLFEKKCEGGLRLYFHRNQSISTIDDPNDIALIWQIREYVRRKDRPVALTDLYSHFEYAGYRTTMMRYDLRLGLDPYFYLTGPDEIMAYENMPVTDEFLKMCREKLMEKLGCTKQQPLLRMYLLDNEWLEENLPRLHPQVPWNRVILQQVMIFHGEALGIRLIRVHRVGELGKMHSYAALWESPIQTMSDAVWQDLHEDGMTGQTVKIEELCKWLLKNGVVEKKNIDTHFKVMNMLSDGNHFHFNSDGSIVTIEG